LQNQYQIFPLGNTAAVFDLGNTIDEQLNRQVLAMQHWLQANPFRGMLDCMAAYSSLTVWYDPLAVKKYHQPADTIFKWVAGRLQYTFEQAGMAAVQEPATVRIPVCYEAPFAPDLAELALLKQLSKEEIIRIHIAAIYHVYMIGFLPGFSYMGKVSERIAVPRKAQPAPVAAGSVGIAGWQTGIYPMQSPGGWQIIGRTPLKLFDPFVPEPVPLKAGDKVQFYAITKEEFEEKA
jgi:inhibitor of KinA